LEKDTKSVTIIVILLIFLDAKHVLFCSRLGFDFALLAERGVFMGRTSLLLFAMMVFSVLTLTGCPSSEGGRPSGGLGITATTENFYEHKRQIEEAGIILNDNSAISDSARRLDNARLGKVAVLIDQYVKIGHELRRTRNSHGDDSFEADLRAGELAQRIVQEERSARRSGRVAEPQGGQNSRPRNGAEGGGVKPFRALQGETYADTCRRLGLETGRICQAHETNGQGACTCSQISVNRDNYRDDGRYTAAPERNRSLPRNGQLTHDHFDDPL
jgi:hypothetical protein